MTISKQNSGDLKLRVNSCLNKLSDRDTLSMAATELETIARTLHNDSFAPFLSCLSATDSSEKSPVRRHCVRLLTVLSAAHGDALSPHLHRMISAVLRRLRDPDSSVRAACVDAVSAIATHVGSPPFSVVLKPLVDALFREQDASALTGACLCLAAAVVAAREPDAAELRRVLPRVLKMVRGECSKAKPALMVFVGSVVGAGFVRSRSLLGSVVSAAVDLLGSEDWAARKAAAEVLEKVAAAGGNVAAEFKDCCVAALESRRFDKVKVVRETMNRALETWRDVPVLSEDAPSPKDSTSGGQSPVLLPLSPGNISFETPQAKKMMPTKSTSSSSSSTISIQKSSIGKEDSIGKPFISNANKLKLKKNFRSRVVPFNCNDDPNVAADGFAVEDKFENQKEEFEDLSLIRKQLLQIEKQQSNLFDLLQRFIGSSQKGISSLEKRVDGLEKVLGEMSQDFSISTRRISAVDSSGNSCCMIPGAEFLSPKFWRKTEGQTVAASKSFPSHRNHSLHGTMTHKD